MGDTWSTTDVSTTTVPSPMRFTVVQYNMLKNELCNNFSLRSMEPIAETELKDLLGVDGAKAAIKALEDLYLQEKEQRSEYNDKATGWHNHGKEKILLRGEEVTVRTLWGEQDLTRLVDEQKGKTDLRGKVTIIDDVSCSFPNGVVKKTLLGVLTDMLDRASAEVVFSKIKGVNDTKFDWSTRGPRILELLMSLDADVIVLEEYDVHKAPLALFTKDGPRENFSAAMHREGYDGRLFAASTKKNDDGVGIFWKRSAFHLLGQESDTNSMGVVAPGPSLDDAIWNVDLEEPDHQKPDRMASESNRRSAAFVTLVTRPGGDQVIVAATHLMTTSRDDKKGTVRRHELGRIRLAMQKWARPGQAAILAGDFNIDMQTQESIFEQVDGYKRLEVDHTDQATYPQLPHMEPGTTVKMFDWRSEGAQDSSQLVFVDAYGDVDHRPESASSRTHTRREMIDYVWYSPQKLRVVARSPLVALDETMPNTNHPSDHIALSVSFETHDPQDSLRVSSSGHKRRKKHCDCLRRNARITPEPALDTPAKDAKAVNYAVPQASESKTTESLDSQQTTGTSGTSVGRVASNQMLEVCSLNDEPLLPPGDPQKGQRVD